MSSRENSGHNIEQGASLTPPSFAEQDLNLYLRMIRGDVEEKHEYELATTTDNAKRKNIVILVTSPYLGVVDDKLGRTLLVHFIRALLSNRTKPRAIIFTHQGTELLLPASEVYEDLNVLHEQGIRIMACLESVRALKLDDDIGVGCISDMDNICDLMLSAAKVITLK